MNSKMTVIKVNFNVLVYHMHIHLRYYRIKLSNLIIYYLFRKNLLSNRCNDI